MINLFKKFMKEESGATMVEYAILVALIAVAVAVILVSVGTQLTSLFQKVINCLTNADTASCNI